MTVVETPERTPGPDPERHVGHPLDAPHLGEPGDLRSRPDPEQRWRWIHLGVDAVVVAACAAFAFWQLHPDLILQDNTPAGGDMGAHVWALAYLRDHLLTDGLLSGWTPDWYAGFPAFHFYMVVPFLAMVVLNTGLAYPLALLPLAAAAGTSLAAFWAGPGRRRTVLVLAVAALLLFGVSFPYGVAFKLVSVSGVVTMPVSAYFMARWAGLRFPAPAMSAAFLVAFLFDQNFTIYGGNAASTMAGEFAFSISLSLALLYVGILLRGLRTGRHRGWAALLLALTGLCHLIPAFFALGVTAVALLSYAATDAVRGRRARRQADDQPPAWRRWWWTLGTGATAGLLSAFWVLPFFWRRTYLNDMGWEKKAVWDEGESFSDWFFGRAGQETYDQDGVLEFLVPPEPTNLRLVAALALVGAVLGLVARSRWAVITVVTALTAAGAFIWLPQGRLWNARVLPFWYLCLYLLAAYAAAEVARAVALLVARDTTRPPRGVIVAAPLVVTLVVTGIVGLSLKRFPFASSGDDGAYGYGALYRTSDSNFVAGWARWNYSGYEGKTAYPEYNEIVTTMARIGEERGCGRALWEYESDKLGAYGTPMALMLLPHWTDGCIGSMEGLYFEASSTTPFHFLMQSELSAKPSRAQRDMPYRDLSVDEGVEHLQLMGVRYYMAFSVEATTAARANPDLTELASTVNGWVVFEVADSELVTPLSNRPAVTTSGQSQHEWLCAEHDDGNRCSGPALDWFQDPSQWDVALAATGPSEWQRVDWGERPERVSLPAVTVSDIHEGNRTIRFSVSEPGVPVLVKASYFPSWTASGAEGPYRVAPNLMVVVPTDQDVTLRYQRTPVDWLAILATLGGIALLVLLFRRPPVAVPTWTRPPAAPEAGAPPAPPAAVDAVDDRPDPPAADGGGERDHNEAWLWSPEGESRE